MDKELLLDAFGVPRMSVRMPLARLEALKKVGVRKVGMARVYYLARGKYGGS